MRIRVNRFEGGGNFLEFSPREFYLSDIGITRDFSIRIIDPSNPRFKSFPLFVARQISRSRLIISFFLFSDMMINYFVTLLI